MSSVPGPDRAQASEEMTLVVVTWQSSPALAGLIDSMNRFLTGAEELIVVDNDSTDRPLEAARRWKGGGWFIAMDRNGGYGAAANAGVAAAAHQSVAILNSDIELLDDGLGRLAAAASAEHRLMGPRVLESDGSLQPSASGPPTGAWPWVRALLPSRVGPAPLLARTAPWRLPSRTEVSWLTGCCLAGPRDALADLGPFDTSISLYGEDMDLGLRAAGAGLTSVFAPDLCRLRHAGKASTSQRVGDFGRALAAKHGREILVRHFGAAAEARVHRAEALHLRLRLASKALLRRDRDWEALILRSARSAPAPSGALAQPAEPAAPTSRLRLGG